MLSPPMSPPMPPQSPRQSGNRPGGHGHRRGGSEFVGGNIRSGEAITASISPTKSESGFASPTFPPKGPPAGRRGHAHRRSAALSGVDLSAILQPNTVPRGSSAPTSPADFDKKTRPFFDPADEPLKLDTVVPPAPVAEKTPTEENKPPTKSSQNSPSKPPTRARVGFSDTLEFIPRPLSLVSSDTSSTITVRPGHSVSGSISSVVSTHNQAITEREGSMLGVSPRKKTESRPRTAEAVMERTQEAPSLEQTPSPRRRNSIPHLSSSASEPSDAANPSPTKTPKRWSFFGLEPFTGSTSPKGSRPVSPSSSDTPTNVETANGPSEEQPSDCHHLPDFAAVLRQGGKKKKQRRVRAWAGSILTRRSKTRTQKDKAAVRRSQTPPPALPSHQNDLLSPDLPPERSTTPPAPTLLITESTTPPGTFSGLPPKRAPVDEDMSYPVIDLDAALGPFNTPLPHNPEWEAAMRAGMPHKRQLHSAAGLRGFSGPGMHYHRRAESAPEMVPFEAGRFGLHRLGSSSTMADVFEEDEEDEATAESGDAAVTSSNSSDVGTSSDLPTPVATTADETSTAPGSVQHSKPCSIRSLKTDGEPDDSRLRQPSAISVRSQQSASSLQDEIIPEEEPAPCPQAVVFPDSAAPSPRHVMAKDLAPVDVSLKLPPPSIISVSPYAASHSSAFPSPRSPLSCDTQHASTAPTSTAPSSYTDENNFQSLLLGEPGPELRISVDIPSLTSSNSTMTRESAGVPPLQPFSRIPFQPTERPSSVTSAAFSRRRSSLASLSRLISSSHGERSKLSMEVPADAGSVGKEKVSRAKRLSRMMQFWKPKEASNSSNV